MWVLRGPDDVMHKAWTMQCVIDGAYPCPQSKSGVHLDQNKSVVHLEGHQDVSNSGRMHGNSHMTATSI